MKIRKGDKVRVMAGKDKGREGTVERVYASTNSVLIDGVNLFKKHVKKSEKMPQGGLVTVPRSLNVSKILYICGKCKKPVRLGYKVDKGTKIRVCRTCGTKV
jgi:large subunit ribosomal protein L24